MEHSPARINLNPNNYSQNFVPQSTSLKAEEEGRSHYVKLLTYALIAIFCYYVGAFLLIFVRNVDGALSTSIQTQEVSFRVAFENFPQLVRNIFENVFGYFNQYSKLYNRDTKFLIPFDVGVKLLVIGYFIFFWMPWDTLRNFRRGFFSLTYPYVDEEVREKYSSKVSKAESKTEPVQLAQNHIPQPSVDSKGSDLYRLAQQNRLPEYYNSNPYLKAQLLSNSSQPTNAQAVAHSQSYEDEDEEDEEGILPFDGVHKPLEEIYQKYEKTIYSFIRRQILPGSNILLVGYFSTLFIVDLANPLSMVGYILGVMSMFWCMQSFLMVLDHSQFPPEQI